MIKVSVLYPAAEDKTFDMDYYCQLHLPMVRRLLGTACTDAAVEQGLAGGTPGSSPTYVAMGHLYFNTVDDFISSFTPQAAAIMNDIPNYTDTTPIIQISEVKL